MQEHVVNVMRQGEYFGENGLVSNAKRKANIMVPSDADGALIFVVPKALFIRTGIHDSVREERAELIATLRQSHMFDDMSESAFQDFASIVRPVEYRHNSVILRQGEPCSRFCILVKGICHTLKFADYGAELLKRKRELEQQLEQFEMSYSVHHANVNTSRRSRGGGGYSGSNINSGANTSSSEAGGDGKQGFRSDAALQSHERRKQELARVVDKLRAVKEDVNGTFKVSVALPLS